MSIQRKYSKIKRYPLYLGNILKDFTVVNMRKTGLNGYVNRFFVDYSTIDVGDIDDIHKYIKKLHSIK